MTKQKMDYAEALRIVQDLATGNQIDAIDVAFADESLEVQRRLQDTALETVQAYLDNGGADGLPEAPGTIDPSQAGDAQEDEPDAHHLPDAVRIVLDMGRNNILDDKGPDMADEVARQERAADLVADLLGRHADALVTPKGPSAP